MSIFSKRPKYWLDDTIWMDGKSHTIVDISVATRAEDMHQYVLQSNETGDTSDWILEDELDGQSWLLLKPLEQQKPIYVEGHAFIRETENNGFVVVLTSIGEAWKNGVGITLELDASSIDDVVVFDDEVSELE